MAQPNTFEQYSLELLNRFRIDPLNEYDRLVNSGDADVDSAISFFNVNLALLESQFLALAPAAPVAWSTLLHDSATTHNNLMITFDQQSHNLPGEPGLLQRVQNAGYNPQTVGENIFANSKSAFHGHAAFVIDWGNTPTGIQNPPGHRNSMINPAFREVGISIVPENDPNTNVGPELVTHHLATSQELNSSNESWLLGVAFRDTDDDDFYTPGEGLDNVTVNITGITNNSFSTSLSTQSAGGYQALLPENASYNVDFLRDGNIVKSETIALGTENLKLDLLLEVGTPPAAGKGKIVGNKFEDANGNAIWDSGESGLSGWTIFLDENDDRQLNAGELSTVTDANGEYIFNNLDPGTYEVLEVLQPGWQQTFPDPSNPIGAEVYRFDDGENEGWTSYGDRDHLIFNTFETQAGAETINAITLELSSRGNPSKVFLYQDADGDDRPDANEQLLEITTNLTGSDDFTSISIPETTVSGTFFVAALYEGNGTGNNWIYRDNTQPTAGQSYVALSSPGSSINLNSFSSSVFNGNWMLRASATGLLPQLVTVAADETIANINFGNQQTGITALLPIKVNGADSLKDPLSHGGASQDMGDFEVNANARSINLTGNGWKHLAGNYNITSNTVLKFDYQSGVEGEVQGIGFDNDNGINNSSDRNHFFQVDGTQGWGNRDLDAFITANVSGITSYEIPVGDFFTGSFSRLVIGNDHDVTNPTASATYSNIELKELPTSALPISINGADSLKRLLSHGGASQDMGDFQVDTNARSVNLTGNGWKHLAGNYNITSDTLLKFDYQAGVEGEVQGIGFDNDNGINNSSDRNHFFQVDGTQTWGNQNLDAFITANVGGITSYEIPVGDFFAGNFSRLVLGNDHDVTSPTASATFSNIELF
ncbi:hypothetical protein IQ260_14570 [Leptolyngbya cf. ectocarpi LEGE 11479]|uniref:SCP domain-containing protein n=1 Tax=Leptolyngbya cf. ectocarpi LEGE 11479 TaxID=1828722 RepID=A0A928ZUZ8_LEPEC|nr:SdrD B-like domain-containing protein [Leptolyngbya ectocarpi]MBE9067875.1 hypothetical protein [Leptolyngbya cf. ectocarpi LEGE 11479]